MRITVVIDNNLPQADAFRHQQEGEMPSCALKAEHGLCLFVETGNDKFFFDFGQTDLFLANANALGIDVAAADFAIVSHGHYDHGGGIAAFLAANSHAPVFLRDTAFANCYSERAGRMRYIGLAPNLVGNERLTTIAQDGGTLLDGRLTLFSLQPPRGGWRDTISPANSRIYKKVGEAFVHDTFEHEMNAILVEGNRRVLIAGCAHSGIVNIIRRAEQLLGSPLTDVIGGMHLKGVEDEAYIDRLAAELMRRDCRYYTCHCTGDEAFARLRSLMGNQIEYVACGAIVD